MKKKLVVLSSPLIIWMIRAETILMRLIRGESSTAFKRYSFKTTIWTGCVDPSLLYFKKRIFQKFFHYEDKSNRSLDYFRNRIRHRYLPLLEKENPQVTSALVNPGEGSQSLAPGFKRVDQRFESTRCDTVSKAITSCSDLFAGRVSS